MTDNEKKIELLKEMVETGYHMMNRTYESFCEDFDLETIKRFHQCWMTRNYPI